MKSKWIHTTKYKNKEFIGSYETKKNGQRIFNLTCGSKEFSFESFHQAKKLGWSLIKSSTEFFSVGNPKFNVKVNGKNKTVSFKQILSNYRGFRTKK
jgi:hypothetical protein